MVAATNSIRAVPKKAQGSTHMPSVPLSIAPRGNRSTMPTVKRAPRIGAKNTRDYAKGPGAESIGFDIPGFGEE